MSTQIDGDAHVRGHLSAQTMTIPAASVDNDAIAADNISATKLQHQHHAGWAGESDTTAAAQDYVIHTTYGATGTVIAFRAGLVVACVGDSTVSVDLHNNGASILAAAVTIDSGDAAYALVAGTVDTPAVVTGDVLEVVVTVSAGTGTLGKGVFCDCVVNEDPA